MLKRIRIWFRIKYILNNSVKAINYQQNYNIWMEYVKSKIYVWMYICMKNWEERDFKEFEESKMKEEKDVKSKNRTNKKKTKKKEEPWTRQERYDNKKHICLRKANICHIKFCFTNQPKEITCVLHCSEPNAFWKCLPVKIWNLMHL